MSGLVFLLDPEGVLVGMDSLAVRTDVSPHKFCTKVLGLPHLMAVVCGTGGQRLILDWYLDIQENVLARDIDFVNQIAPARLNELYAQRSDAGPTTIYHFGFSSLENCFAGWAFRSGSAFACERVAYGIGLKPGFEDLVPDAAEVLYASDGPEGISELLGRIRTLDDALPVERRVGIGGEVHVLLLNGSGQMTHLAHRWPDYDTMYVEMLDRLSRQNAEADAPDA